MFILLLNVHVRKHNVQLFIMPCPLLFDVADKINMQIFKQHLTLGDKELVQALILDAMITKVFEDKTSSADS